MFTADKTGQLFVGDAILKVGNKNDNDHYFLHHTLSTTQQTREVVPMLVLCWASLVDGRPTLKQHWFNVSCLLGRHCNTTSQCCLKKSGTSPMICQHWSCSGSTPWHNLDTHDIIISNLNIYLTQKSSWLKSNSTINANYLGFSEKIFFTLLSTSFFLYSAGEWPWYWDVYTRWRGDDAEERGKQGDTGGEILQTGFTLPHKKCVIVDNLTIFHLLYVNSLNAPLLINRLFYINLKLTLLTQLSASN